MASSQSALHGLDFSMSSQLDIMAYKMLSYRELCTVKRPLNVICWGYNSTTLRGLRVDLDLEKRGTTKTCPSFFGSLAAHKKMLILFCNELHIAMEVGTSL